MQLVASEFEIEVLIDGELYEQVEVDESEELYLQLVQLFITDAAHLGIVRVVVVQIVEELSRAQQRCEQQSMEVE